MQKGYLGKIEKGISQYTIAVLPRPKSHEALNKTVIRKEHWLCPYKENEGSILGSL